ncbi:MAG: ABC transporter permease [Thermoplasmatales archaeon]
MENTTTKKNIDRQLQSKLRATLNGIADSGVFKSKKSLAGLIILFGYIILALLGPFITPYSPFNASFPTNMAPSAAHLLGTDAYGRDILSRILYGAGPTLGIGLLVGFTSTLISILVGISAGVIGGKYDKILDGFTYIFIIIPGIMFIILIGSLFIGIGQNLGYFGVYGALTLTGWAWGARVLRSQTKSVVARNFIISSKLIGESRLSVIWQIVRNIYPLIASNFFFASLYGVLGLTWIEFFGLGNINSINWGTMLYWAVNNEAYLTGEWWYYIPVSILISGLALSFSLLNSGFDEIANPSLKSFKRIRNMTKIEKSL